MEDTKFMMPGLPVANISGPYYTAKQMHEYAKSAIDLFMAPKPNRVELD